MMVCGNIKIPLQFINICMYSSIPVKITFLIKTLPAVYSVFNRNEVNSAIVTVCSALFTASVFTS